MKRFLLAILALFISLSGLFANHGDAPDAAKVEEKKFQAGNLIMGHIADEHGWHICGEGENAIVISLPVIIYSSERGLDVFSSSKFHHGEETYKGYKLEKNKIVAVNEMGSVEAEEAVTNEELSAKLYDISITKNVVSIFVTFALMLWLFLSAAKAITRNPGTAPKGFQTVAEWLVIFVRDDIAKSAIGEKKYMRYLPFLLTIFFFIFINNLLGLIPFFPGGANVTGNISVALVLAAMIFIITLISAKSTYWRHIFAMPGVPIGVLFILTPIEIFGMFLKPLVLMIRLFANILAGHIIALSFFSLIFIFAEMNQYLGWGVSVLSIAFTVFMGFLELLVAFLQAYVFTLLSAMYFGSAIEEHHHEEAH